MILHDGEGRDVYFDFIEPGQKTRNHFERMDLERHTDHIIFRTKDNLTCYFTGVGHEKRLYLTKIADANDSKITLKYNDNAHLFEIVDSVGRRM